MPTCTRRVPFVADLGAYRQHYGQRGGNLPIFRGLSHQDGYGVGGGIFSNIFKAIVPVLKNTAKSAGKTLLKTGTRVLTDVVSGERDIKSALKRRGLEALGEVGTNVKKRVVNDVFGADSTGRKKRRGAPPKRLKKRQTTTRGRRSRKSRRRQTGGQGGDSFFQ